MRHTSTAIFLIKTLLYIILVNDTRVVYVLIPVVLMYLVSLVYLNYESKKLSEVYKSYYQNKQFVLKVMVFNKEILLS